MADGNRIGDLVGSGARAILLALSVALAGAGVAHAHSGLQRAEPASENTVTRAPEEVRLYFSEQLEPAYSSVRVESAAGEQVDRKDSRVDDSNPLLLRVSLPHLDPGTYTVIWRVLSVDSHVTEGRFHFTVK